MKYELIQVVADQLIKYGPEDGVGRQEIISVIEDRQGRLLAANRREVFEFVAPPEAQKGRIGFHVEPADELTGARLLETFDAINSAAPPTLVPAPPSAGAAAATSGSSPAEEPAPRPASDR